MYMTARSLGYCVKKNRWLKRKIFYAFAHEVQKQLTNKKNNNNSNKVSRACFTLGICNLYTW